MFWGYSPALDLFEEYKKHYELPHELNILIYGGVDARHVLKTISRLHRHSGVCKVNIYIQDILLEQVARQLLLLTIAFDKNKNLNESWKIRTFMELYGNTLLRPNIAKHLTKKAKYLIDIITNDLSDTSNDSMENVNLEKIKYKERDYLENLFQFWIGNNITFNISELWNERVRQYLAERYDSRLGVFDWDLHMTLHQIGASQITIQEYKKWRNFGVAFTWTHSELTLPNRSLACGYTVAHGVHQRYVGDITISPYIAYGLDSEDKSLFEKRNGQNKFRATDVTEHNLREIFHELFKNETCSESVKKSSIHFLSCTNILENNKYHIVWLASFLIDKSFTNAFNSLLDDNSIMIIEGIKYDPKCRKEDYEIFNNKIKNYTSKQINCRMTQFDAAKDSFATIVKCSTS